QPMQLEDVEEVARVEKECFTTPWPVNAYRRELRENRLSRYVVVRWLDEDEAPASPAPAAPTEADDDPLAGVRRAVSSLLRPFGLAERVGSRGAPAILGFAGMWLMFDEAHITTIGVRRSMRGRGLGELMLIHLIDQAREMGAKRLTLEVRVSNNVAQELYRKYTFKEEGVRKRYYSDDGEDALIMWSDRIDEPAFVSRFAELRARLQGRLASVPPPNEQALE
ncbi:MAG TPA: ribosomal protein S18-alanine N-acetyltransferase, partial [Chloroflexota bacterium]